MFDHDFFRLIPQSAISFLESIVIQRHFSPGQRIFGEGVKHSEIHVVRTGHVRLEMFVPGRGPIPVLSVGSGDLLGWSPLLGDSVMTASAIALDSVTTLSFPGELLRQKCESDHDFGFVLMRVVAKAVSRRLEATRLQLLDLYKDHTSIVEVIDKPLKLVDDQC